MTNLTFHSQLKEFCSLSLSIVRDLCSLKLVDLGSTMSVSFHKLMITIKMNGISAISVMLMYSPANVKTRTLQPLLSSFLYAVAAYPNSNGKVSLLLK